MVDQQNATLYIRFRKRVRLDKAQPILLRNIADILSDPEIEQKLQTHVISYPQPQDGNLVLVDMLMVIRSIREIYSNLKIESFGEPHVLIEIKSERARPHFIILALVWLLLFVGSGLTILNFHADVSMLEVHQRIYQLLTGKHLEHPYFLQIPYSIGIGLGMVLFFNHVFKKKFSEEPSPLEVEMFLYQESTNRYVITQEYGKIRKRKKRDNDDESPF
ncbi:stage V sporulation protein AA [Paenibacillus psychroresistens]|uniref:Stage V sporulation protein AA n=1 Tax=Paenibacillus psychroresistens TaxID=1778678 RepID=A0A6B8RKC5_9BACL|nr:stage V sporulation protein AA [Paenibacillus psychroresistens]QGQ96003.1 stage V sporulation protein AA [Paenibacillus psychroresistens]